MRATTEILLHGVHRFLCDNHALGASIVEEHEPDGDVRVLGHYRGPERECELCDALEELRERYPEIFENLEQEAAQ